MKVCFIFRQIKGRGFGGAEKSMFRMINYAHPTKLDCSVIFVGLNNSVFSGMISEIGVPCFFSKNGIDLFNTLKQINPAIVYLFTRTYLFYWGIIARFSTKAKIIAAERGSADTSIDKISQIISKFIVNGYITNSLSASKNLQKAGISSKRIFTSYNGIEYINQQEKLNKQISKKEFPLIVCIANIMPQKGQIYLLKAANLLKGKYPSIKVLLIGNDYTKGEFFKRMENIEINYEWLGSINNIKNYLALADVFVLPSLPGREGMPTSILEAMNENVPIIASNVNGTNELVLDRITGLLFEPCNFSELAEKIDLLLCDVHLREKMLTNARNLIVHRHTLSKMLASHLEAFSNL